MSGKVFASLSTIDGAVNPITGSVRGLGPRVWVLSMATGCRMYTSGLRRTRMGQGLWLRPGAHQPTLKAGTCWAQGERSAVPVSLLGSSGLERALCQTQASTLRPPRCLPIPGRCARRLNICCSCPSCLSGPYGELPVPPRDSSRRGRPARPPPCEFTGKYHATLLLRSFFLFRQHPKN